MMSLSKVLSLALRRSCQGTMHPNCRYALHSPSFSFSLFSFLLITSLTQYLFFLVQLEALCILTSFASGPAEHRRVIVEVGVLPQLVNLLHSSRNQDIREEVKSFISFPKNCICFFGTISVVNDSFFYLFSS